jgi:hypothetical protein
MHLIKHPQYGDMVSKEIEQAIVKPFVAESSTNWEPSKILDMLNFENIHDLNFYSNCFNEALRM